MILFLDASKRLCINNKSVEYKPICLSIYCFSISITRDGINYGAERVYRVYHGHCSLCTDEVSECAEVVR